MLVKVANPQHQIKIAAKHAFCHPYVKFLIVWKFAKQW